MPHSYKWKVLTDDGLLKEPEPMGPYYDQTELNGYKGGFETVEEAEQALRRWEPRFSRCDNYILVKLYTAGL